MSQNHPFSPSPNPSSNIGFQMSNEELLSRRSDWTLACDNALLNRLRDFSENLVTSARELSANCDSLSDDVSNLQFNISNITNEFLMLADTRFVENRVQEFEEFNVVDKHPPKQVVEPSKAEKEAALIEKMKESIQIGVSIQQDRDKLRSISLEDSTRSTDTGLTSSVNLAHLIGSSKFFSSKYCGLLKENNRVGYSPAASSVPSSSSSLVGASEANNASDKLIFPNFDEDMMRQINSTSQISSASAGGFGSLENFAPPKAPPFPDEFFNSNIAPIRPPTPHSPTSSTSSSFFESNSGVPSAVANLFNSQSQEQQIISVRPVTITPPDPDMRPPPILDVSDSDDDDIFNSPSAFQQNTSGIQSHFFNQAVPSYAYTQNIFDEPPPEPKPVPGPTPTLTVAATAHNAFIGNPAPTADVSSISKPKTSKEENFKEVIKSLTRSRDTLKSSSSSKPQVNHNVHLPRKVETEPEPETVTVPRAEPNKSQPPQNPPQTEGKPQFKMPQPPKRTTIFDDSDSDDDLFATMSKPKTQKSISSSLFKSPPSLPSDNQNQTNLNNNQNCKFNNPEQDLRRPSVLDLSENESDDGDDIFKSLSYASKIGQRKNDNDSFLNLISPSLPVHESLRDSQSPVDRDPIPVNFESPAAASVEGRSQNQNQFQKNIQNESEHLEVETATSKSDSQSLTYSHASLESDIIPINVNDTPSPTPSVHSEFQSQHQNSKVNSSGNEKQIKPAQAKSEDTSTRTNYIHDGSDHPNLPVSSAVEDDFFDPEPAPVRASRESTSTKTTSGIPKVVTVTNNDTQSFASAWLPPVPACPPSPTISTDEEDDFDIFKSQQSRIKTVVIDSQNKIHPQPEVPTAIHNPTPGPVQLNTEPPEVPISNRLPESAPTLTPVAAPVVKPKLKLQNVDRLKSKSIFDSSDSDDDLFSSKSKSIKSSPSVKDVSPQPSNISYFKDERYVEPQVQAPTIKPLHAPLNVNEPPPFISKSLSSNNGQKEIDEHNAILNRAPRILDLSDEDSDDDLFTSMAKTQNQSRQRQQQEIKVIDSAPATRKKSTSFASSLYVSAPADFPTQDGSVASAPKFFAEATVSKGHAEDPVSNSILADADTLNSSTTAPAPSVSVIQQQQNQHEKQGNFDSNSNAKISSESTTPLPRNKSKAESKTILKEKSIFESSESDDDLFSTTVKTPTIPKSMSYSISSPFLKSNSKSPVITRSASISESNSTFGKSKSKSKTLSLFDDSDDDDSSDLFKGSSSSQIKTKDKVISSPVPQADQGSPETEANGKDKNSAVLESNKTVPQSDKKPQYDKDIITNSIVENALKSKSLSSSSVTEIQSHSVEGNNPRDNIFGAVAKSLENIFSANKNNIRIVSSTATLSSNFLDSISFDQEASTENLLHCVTKSRPKILHQRRPPSLKRRQYSKSTSSLHNITPTVDTNELDPLV